jgi:hypothetical protein
MDSASFNAFTQKITGDKPMTRDEFAKYIDTLSGSGMKIRTGNYKNKAEYDSLLKAGVVKDNWIERTLQYKLIELSEKYHNDKRMIASSFINALTHSFPQMLFISLPLFALILKLLYIRRKKFYYASHVIFSIHFYVFAFIIILLLIGVDQAKHNLQWNWLDFVTAAGVLYLLFYLYKAMRKFYLQRRAKTIVKYMILNLLMYILIILLFVIFALFSFFKI